MLRLTISGDFIVIPIIMGAAKKNDKNSQYKPLPTPWISNAVSRKEDMFFFLKRIKHEKYPM